ncbi:MAG: DUF5716 family protein [Bacteroides sp.]|nr:DUF5716 family protein [Bacteroides sp.]MCM1548981.1 DUF5716 family protein [Clostridium sp.]
MQNFYLGMDVCAEHTQLSFFNQQTKEPESICQLNTVDTYLLPNVAFFGEEAKRWYIGSEAVEHRFHQKGTMLEHVVEKLESTERMIFHEETYTYEDVLLLILKGHIMDFLNRYEDAHIERLVVTVYKYSNALFRVLHMLQDELGLYEQRFFIIGHTSAYLHFIFQQPESLRNNSVGLFDYGPEGLMFYRVDIARKTTPQVVTVIHKDYREQMGYYRIYDNKKELDQRFLAVVQEVLKEAYMSAVYLTGVGFTELWANASQNVLCDGRRVFVGQNIYTKGACYAAYIGSHVINPNKYIVNAEDMVHSDVGILSGDASNTFIPIAKGGREWYNMRGKLCVCLDDTNRVELLYKNHYNQEALREIIEIHGLPSRPNKTTRLSLEVEMYSGNRGAVVIRDEGFGKLYPTTNKIYRKEFLLEKEG